jgi:hypothetical protein
MAGYWGELNAWESDWNKHDDSYVETVDFVFYTGHANGTGWVLSEPDDDFLDVTEVSGPRDRWGAQDLEWIIIAACGAFQDDLISACGGNAFRWRAAFDGLHTLLGYGAATFEYTDEGARFARYAKGGQRVIDAWSRTSQELQPATNGYPAPDVPTV